MRQERRMSNCMNSDILFSVIVPVYNKEDSISRCLDSLGRQDSDLFEVIFIDDGSTDSSPSKCEAFCSSNDRFHLLHQTNQGVSAARNKGVSFAKGRYLLFLDADDALTDGSIKALSRFVFQHDDDVDVISYPLMYVNTDGKIKSGHLRDKWLNKDGVYSLSEYPYIAQTTMNVCVKNRFRNNIDFSTALKMGEDQLYITSNLCRKGAIGCCLGAGYLYTRDGSGASSYGNNPLYSYTDMLALFESCLSLGLEYDSIKSYTYQIILYNIAWRLKSSMLFPVHLTGEQYSLAELALRDVIRSIPVDEIIQCPYMNDYHKGFLIKHFELLNNPPKIIWDSAGRGDQDNHVDNALDKASQKRIALELDGGLNWRVQKPTFVIMKAMERIDGIHVEGRLVFPGFPFIPKPRLFCSNGTETVEIGLSTSSFNYSGSKQKTAVCWTVRWVFPRDCSCSYRFIMHADSNDLCVLNLKLNKGLLRCNARREKGHLYYPDIVVYIENDSLVVRQKKFIDCCKSAFFGFRRDHLMWARRLLVKLFRFLYGRKEIWLYSDLPTSCLAGNAFFQLQHDLASGDGVRRFYITDDVAAFQTEHPVCKGHIVKRNSVRHFLLSINANMILTSYLERYMYLPYRKSTYSGVGDLAGNQWHIYLQHGVLHAHLPWYYSLDRIAFDCEVISTFFERDNLLSNYCFTEEALIASGMPRLDRLNIQRVKKRKILYAPSWRNYLVGGNGKKRIADDRRLQSSSFYEGFIEFLSNKSLLSLLSESGYTLEVKLHPNFSCYDHLLDFESDNIRKAELDIVESDYSIIITDYSSYVFDFVYCDASVLYFLPDATEFKAGLNHYRQLDLPFVEAFGPFTSTAEAAVFQLARVIRYRDGEGDSELDAFRNRSREFFLHRDGGNCDRLYRSLRELNGPRG